MRNKNEWPYNMKVRDEWERLNKEWNILAVEDKLECDEIKCSECKWYNYCEFYQMKEESE